ncbi:potassium-transporting ATPase subunit KdpA [Gorillibacterium sp. CAU 1737]|uniref:potassium-transporting ATPase subunit KdpA n=1 Tax=Gorillibacterium sp. CAU 1737 TaxID=3140362 RepID=UPI003260F998
MKGFVLQDGLFLLLLIGLSIPLGRYMARVMAGERVWLSRVLSPVERGIYRCMGVKPEEDMTAWRYAGSVLLFSGVGLVVVLLLQLLQGGLPFNPEHKGALGLGLAFNTAASFVSNTNWQAYSGEATLSYLTQALGLTVQNFVSAATGLAVVFALIRGFLGTGKGTLGSFWRDLVRGTLYILLPLSLVLALLLVSQGVVQSFDSYRWVHTLADGVNQLVPLGPAASQIAIKQLGTNGGGFFGANSAYPLENPTAFSNLLELLAILLLPAALCVSFGVAVKKRKEGRTLYAVMLVLFLAALAIVTFSEHSLGPVYSGVAAGGSMEGKEVIHGVGTSSLWATATTAASNGAVNAMHDSFTPLSGMMMLFLMQLGEIVFGGVGSGLYGMIAFVILTVFIAGLMVGRTPEYLGKKIEPYDMKMVCLIVLTPPLLTLIGTAVAVSLPAASSWLTNPGPHGFSEVLYAFTSMANNNGSAFGGYAANTLFTNVAGGFIMLAARFIPLVAVLLLAGNLGKKKTVAASEGTLSTTSGLFIGMLLGVILLVGALGFLPALALGPIADFLTNY